MSLFKRVLLVVYTFFITIISGVLLMIPFSSKVLDNLVKLLEDNIYISFYSRVIFFFVVALFFAAGISFLYSGLRKNKQNLAVIKATDLGALSISLASIESLALTSLKNTKGIKEMKVDSAKSGEGVDITLQLIVYPEVIVTEMTKKIQTMVKSDVEAATGVKVMNIFVKIENVTNYTMRSAGE